MSVRERKWTTRDGEVKSAWVVAYRDQHGKRRLKTFRNQKKAKHYAAATHIEVHEGTHVADSVSITVKQAGDLWLESAEAAELERTTLEQYRQHLRLHIEPLIGRLRLSQLHVPAIRDFSDRLRKGDPTIKKEKCSATMVKYVVRSLGALLADAQERGLIVRNPVQEMRRGRSRRKDAKAERENGKPQEGIDIPAPGEIKRIIDAAEGKWRPLLLTAVFTGLRASELRGLRWEDIDFKKAELNVRQRADRFNTIGPPKTKASWRTIPLTPELLRTLREWKLECPKKDGRLWLVFPNGEGNVEFHVNIIERGLKPLMLAAGITKPALDDKGRPMRDAGGKPMVEAKYTGLHAFRHFYASWCADTGVSMKKVQTRMGHSNISVTMDTYTHLFADTEDDTKELAKAERRLLA